MFTLDTVKACFQGLVGIYQPDDPAYPTIYSEQTTSSSGIFLQDVHPLCTMENIYNSAPEFMNFDYPAWVTATAYRKGARVTEGGKTYEARAAVLNSAVTAPSADNVNWREIDAFSEWIKRIYGQACNNLMLTVAREKKLHTSAKTLLQSQQLYQGPGMIIDKIIKKSRFVGLEINTASAEGLMVRIDRFGIQLDTAQALTLYLYNSSQEDIVAEFDVMLTKKNTFSWADLADAVIGYMQKGTEPGSVWYLGYYEDDIVGQVISKTMNLSAAPCLSCDDFNIHAYKSWSQYAHIRAIEVPLTELYVDRTLFDTSKALVSTSTNFGMNMSVSVMCDLSPIACTNRMLLADGLSMQLALEFLQQIAFGTRINAVADKTKALAMAELDDKEGSGSFKSQYIKSVRALGLDLSGLNSICMPCSTKGGITKRSI